MRQEHSNGLAIFSIERTVAESSGFEDIVDEFASAKARPCTVDWWINVLHWFYSSFLEGRRDATGRPGNATKTVSIAHTSARTLFSTVHWCPLKFVHQAFKIVWKYRNAIYNDFARPISI